MSSLRLRIDGHRFRDVNDREVTIHGINVAGHAKFPTVPDQPSHEREGFFDGDNVSFVGHPFSHDDAHLHFGRLSHWGYNAIRFVFTWEAIEHEGPGKYDEEWIDNVIRVLRLAKEEYNFYIFMDPHQDVVCGVAVYSPGLSQELTPNPSGLAFQVALELLCGRSMHVDSIPEPLT